MKVNLKRYALEKEALKFVQTKLSEQSSTKPLANRLAKTIRFLEEIETDLELGGECIIELDKARLDAVAERDKTMNFLKSSDDEL